MVGLMGGAPASAPAAGGGGGGGVVPFFYGSNKYAEKIQGTTTHQLTTTTQEFSLNITPGGFLTGVRMQVRSASGNVGTAAADNPWNVLQSITLENIDGSPIMYPMGGYSYMLGSRFARPWWGDPARRWDFAQSTNPSFTLNMYPELKHTAGCLANTDARAQYRIRWTANTFANVITSGTTAPTITFTVYLESWAQPDEKTLRGDNIEPLPPGLNLATLRRRQVLTLNSASADNQFQLSNTGNEIRCLIAVARDSNGARQDYLADPVRWRTDNRSMGVFGTDEIYNRMSDFYEQLGYGIGTRPTGVYVLPRFYDPGRQVGEAWYATANSTYVLIETPTAAGATNLPGTVEWISDEVVPVGPVPLEFESI